MINNINIKDIVTFDFEWAKLKKLCIKLNEDDIGEIFIWTFNKNSILENIEDDYAFYMDEYTHMNESTADFILDNINDKDCVYIESIIIDEKYRRQGIGTKALDFIKKNYKDKYIVLLASALDLKDKIAFMSEDKEKIDGVLGKLDSFYKKSGFKNKNSIYYIN